MSKKKTRRRFGRDVAIMSLGGAMVVPLTGKNVGGEQGDLKRRKQGTIDACNFQASVMTWDFPYRKDPRPHARHNTPHGNLARIQLDAIIDVIDRDSGETQQFVLIAPCRTEWVYAEDRLFQLPSAEYRKIYSLTEERSMSMRQTDSSGASHAVAIEDRYRSLKIDVATYQRATHLKSSAEIVGATRDNKQLVARTRIDLPDQLFLWVLQYPIRTMNFQPKTDSSRSTSFVILESIPSLTIF